MPYLQHCTLSQGKHSLTTLALRVEYSNVCVRLQNAQQAQRVRCFIICILVVAMQTMVWRNEYDG